MQKSFIDIFDELLPQFTGAEASYSGFPKYNIISYKDVSPAKYKVELALAGFSKDDIIVETVLNKLIVRTNFNEHDGVKEDMRVAEYVNGVPTAYYEARGISKRSFSKTFEVKEKYSLEIEDVSFVNGLLTIELVVKVPEEFKPKVYKIK